MKDKFDVVFEIPLVSEAVKGIVKAVLPAETRQEEQILERLTTGYKNLLKAIPPASMPEVVDGLCSTTEQLARMAVLGALGMIIHSMQQQVPARWNVNLSAAAKSRVVAAKEQFYAAFGKLIHDYGVSTQRDSWLFHSFINAYDTSVKASHNAEYVLQLDGRLAAAQKLARSLCFSVLEAIALLIETALVSVPVPSYNKK